MIVFAHLLNDRTGSPIVLATIISVVQKSGEDVRLFVGKQGAGRLDELGVWTVRYWYRRASVRALTFLNLLISQGVLLVKLLCSRDIPRDAVIYVNTLLPFGAGLFGFLTGRRVIYHLHEASVTPRVLRWFLVGIAERIADRAVYVSEFHRSALPLRGVASSVIPNALSDAFMHEANSGGIRSSRVTCTFRVVMLASLREYKGVREYLLLAERFAGHEAVCFELVANEDEDLVQCYFEGLRVSDNVTIHARTKDPCVHYRRASIVVNLSRPDLCQETFGLTLLEAMAFGIPVIAPPVGGPAELVRDGVQGFLIDSRDTDGLVDRVHRLLYDEELYGRMSVSARNRAAEFSHDYFRKEILELVDRRGRS